MRNERLNFEEAGLKLLEKFSPKSQKNPTGNSARSNEKGLRIQCFVHGPHGGESSVILFFEDESRRKRLVVDGRILYASLRAVKCRDVNLPVGMNSYTSWIPVVAGRPLHASGRHSDIVAWADLGEGWQGRAEVLQPETPRRVHPDNRECGQCRIFDAPSGKDMLTRVTHLYANGGYSAKEWEINAEADTRGGPPLTPTNVGWCWKTKSLVAKGSPACEKDFMEKTR